MTTETDRLRVCDLMSERVLAVREDEEIGAVHELMLHHGIRHVPVVDERDRLVGLISHRDLLRNALIEQAVMPPPVERALHERILAREVMTEHPDSVRLEDDLFSAAQLMLENKYGCLPVVGGGGRLVGILTESDFVRMVAEEN